MDSQSKNIALFIPQLDIGGAERFIYYMSKYFINRGYDVDLLLINKKGGFLKKIPEKVNIIEFKPSKTLFSIPYLLNYLNSHEPEVLVSTAGSNMVTSIANQIYRGDTKIILNIASPKSSSVDSSVHSYCIRNFYQNTYKIVAVSEAVKEDLSLFYDISPSKIEVIYNPIDIEKIKKESKKDCSYSNRSKLILSAGRLTNVKDYSTLISAFNIVEKKIDSRLLILGEGIKRKQLQKQIKQLGLEDRVDLPGFVDNPYKYMHLSDIFVLSSQYEGLGNVLIEAMACGTPVISTDCPGGPSEILKNGEYGPLVSVGDHEELANEILNVLNDPISSEVLQDRSKDFSAKKISNKYEKMFFTEQSKDVN